MSSKYNEYLQKKALLNQLTLELEQIEQNEEYSKVVKYQERLEELNKEFGYSLGESLEMIRSMITPFDQQVSHDRRKEDRRKSKPALMRYTNPHTGEVVRARRVNHKTLQAWIQEHGREAVDDWAVKVED